MPKRRSSRFRHPNSTAIKFSSFSPLAVSVGTGKRKMSPGSMGKVVVIFARDFPRWNYELDSPMRFDFWTTFVNASSSGRFWNFKIKGNF